MDCDCRTKRSNGCVDSCVRKNMPFGTSHLAYRHHKPDDSGVKGVCEYRRGSNSQTQQGQMAAIDANTCEAKDRGGEHKESHLCNGILVSSVVRKSCRNESNHEERDQGWERIGKAIPAHGQIG